MKLSITDIVHINREKIYTYTIHVHVVNYVTPCEPTLPVEYFVSKLASKGRIRLTLSKMWTAEPDLGELHPEVNKK